MARPKYNEPCPCGSGRKYRNCHLQADREARARQEDAPLSPPPGRDGVEPPAGRPLWLSLLPWVVGIGGTATGAWVAVAHSREGGMALIVGAVVVAGMIRVFGDPPPPNEDARDPGAIDFGR